MALTLEIFIHMDAVNRNEWTGPGDARPLTELGKQQAERLAEEIAAGGPVNALYSSPSECGKLTSCFNSTRLSRPKPQVVVLHSPTPSSVTIAASSNGEGKNALAACDSWCVGK